METTSTQIEPVTVDFGDGVKREIAYTIGMVKGIKRDHGSLEAFLTKIDENIASVIFTGLVDKTGMSIEQIERTPFSKFNDLVSAALTAVTGKTAAERLADAETQKVKNETQPTVQ